MKRLLTLSAFAVLFGAVAPAAFAKEKATFLTGSYATEEGCKKLNALSSGTAPSVETVPDVLTADGIRGWEGACEFTKVYEHEAGRVWIGLMFCTDAATMVPQTYAFIKGDDGSFEVAASGQDMPEVYVRCEAGKGKK